jgi:hypothetical protein
LTGRRYARRFRDAGISYKPHEICDQLKAALKEASDGYCDLHVEPKHMAEHKGVLVV